MAGKESSGNGNRGRRPTDEERAWLWGRWQELQSETQLGKEHCPTTDRRFARSTIHRIREDDDWDGRISDIRRRAQEIADEKSAEDMSKLLQATRALVNALLKKLINVQTGELTGEANVTGFVAAAKLMKDLQSDPTQRIDLHVSAATEQMAQTITEVINSAEPDPAIREAILAGILGALGRSRLSGGAVG